MEEYSANSYEVNQSKEKQQSVPFSMGKVLFWLAIGILVTGVVSLCLPDILIACCGGYDNLNYEAFDIASIVLMSVSVILMIPCIFVISFKRFANRSVGITVSYIIYDICMGILLSSVFMWILGYEEKSAISMIGVAFLITGGCFLIFGIIGSLMKSMTSILIPVISTLCIGALCLSLMNWFIGSSMVYWITDFVILAVILLEVAVDFGRIKKLAETEYFKNSYSMSVYCAYSLYVDFIMLFIRVLRYVLLFSSRRR